MDCIEKSVQIESAVRNLEGVEIQAETSEQITEKLLSPNIELVVAITPQGMQQIGASMPQRWIFHGIKAIQQSGSILKVVFF